MVLSPLSVDVVAILYALIYCSLYGIYPKHNLLAGEEVDVNVFHFKEQPGQK